MKIGSMSSMQPPLILIKLSPPQINELLERTRKNEKNYLIAGWLMNSCGISFSEMSELRQWAQEEIKHPDEIMKPPVQEEPIIPKKEAQCITCGDPTFLCDCEVKL